MAGKEVKAFDPSKVKLLLGGLEPTGYAPDTKIVISRMNGVSSRTEGVDGDISVNIDPRDSGSLVLSLMHTSTYNDIVYAWLRSVKLTGVPFFPVYFEDPSGQVVDTVGWFETQGDYTTAQETSTLEWTLGLKDATLRPVSTLGVLGTIEAFTGINTLI
mgnify:CR=1 FL=1|tara:strand:- start:880 stop:1356 length:477 start_codon:yes stop_codon:yes gene_type:complete